MYVPAQFRVDDVPTLHALIREHSLATLVTVGPDGLVANHIPMEIDADPLPHGTLRGHVARANPVWHSSRRDLHALAVFVGPQTYITPSWYKTKQETGKVVPTWNYAVVHAYGPLGIVEDRAWLRNLVDRLTGAHEAGRNPRWAVTDAPDDFIDKQLGGIVGIEIPIVRLEGKWKVSQNREPADRAGVVSGLRAAPDNVSHAMARLVANTLDQ
ncbi:MAG: FMN-binding negative transcriptional regulator [Candidatus Rokuibacteriota bacterium]